MRPDSSPPLLASGSALAIVMALYPFIAPLAEIAWFSRMPADRIEEAVAIKQHLQVLNAANKIRCQFFTIPSLVSIVQQVLHCSASTQSTCFQTPKVVAIRLRRSLDVVML